MKVLKTRGETDPLTPPRSLNVGCCNHGEAVPKVEEQRRWETLGEDVCNLARAGNMSDAEFPNDDLLPDKVNIKFNVLCTSVMNWVPRHVHGRDVVAVGHCCRGNFAEELFEQMTKPGAL